MNPTVLVLALLAADGRGSSSSAVSPEARAAPRAHGGLGLVFTGGVAQFSAGLGPGVTAEFGFTLEDELTIALRGSLGAVVGVAAAMLGPTVNWAASDRWSFGVGVALGYLGGFFATDFPATTTLQLPLRAQVALGTRSPTELSRRGFKLFLEVGPGLVLVGSRGLTPPVAAPIERWSVLGALGVLYAW